ncbi:MAG: TlpA disulfide reductase family protein [Granulosicoccaceae bacterium]|jgi:thiol-disulfide isomerase/thioredoxin
MILRLSAVCLLTVVLTACDRAPSNTGVSGNSDDIDTSAAASPSQLAGNEIIGARRPDFRLPDLEDRVRSVAEWDGKVIIVNFWATWCPPCRKEMPAFIELQEQYGEQGLQFVGIAIDEKDKVIDFSDTYGVNYPMLVGDLDAIKLGKAYGNRFGALPYTVIIDREGRIAFTQRGELLKNTAETEIRKLL